MDTQQQAKQQIVERIKQANNILVTVSNNPSVDQLAACIGLTLLLNKMGKHATAVYSGATPSTIEFLQPEKTLETNTDAGLSLPEVEVRNRIHGPNEFEIKEEAPLWKKYLEQVGE